MTQEQRRTWLDGSVQKGNEAVMEALAQLWANDEPDAGVTLSPIRSQTLQPDQRHNFTPGSSEWSQYSGDEDFIEMSQPGDVLQRLKEEA